jgi:protein O-mannosyl-transferase
MNAADYAPPPADPGASGLLSRWAWAAVGALVLGSAVWLVYGRVLHAPLIVDDFTTLEHNPSIRRLWPLWNGFGQPGPLVPSPNTPVSARPLVHLTFAINYHFCGMDPAGYRVVSIGIHIAAALILWMLVYRTLQLDFFAGRFQQVAGICSFASALVWALHPLNTESVAYITQRTESLMGLFYLATLYACVRYWTSSTPAARVMWLAAATLAGLLGALSKEMMASVPAVALVYERTFIAGTFRRALVRSWPLYIGLALGWIPQIVINFHGARTPSAGFHLGLPAYIWWYTQAEVLLLYLKLTFWPWPMSIHYEIPYKETIAVAWPWVLPAALLAIATAALVWRRSSVGFAALCVFAVLSPTLVVPCVGEIVAERRMYVALAAVVPCVVVGFYGILERIANRGAATSARIRGGRWPLAVWLIATAALVLVFAVVSVRRLAAFKDTLTLFEDTLYYQPDDFAILVNLGVELAKNDRTDEAMPYFDRAERLHTDSPILNYRLSQESHKLYYNLGLACETFGRTREAIAYYKRAIELKPDYDIAHYNLALLLHRFGLLQSALDEYEEAIRLTPDFAAAHVNLGALLAGAGRYDEAIGHLEEGVRLVPDATAYVTLVDAYVQLGRRQDAIAAANRGIELARAEGQDELAAQISDWLSIYGAKGAP